MRRIALPTLLTCWLRPATTAPKLESVKLRWAYLIHLLSAMAITLSILCMIEIYLGQESVFEDIANEFARHAAETAFVTVMSLLGVELAFIGLAMVVLPWGAGDERLRSSWAHALRFTWLHTTHAVPLVLVIGALTAHWNIKWDNWWKERQEGGNYESFWVDHGAEILINLGIAASFWMLWALFRAVGARRAIPPIARPPTCESCGYNLSGTPLESRCPECGTPAVDSLGPDARAGTACERGGGWAARLRCSLDAVLRPQHLGRQIQVTTQSLRHCRCLCFPLLTAFVALAAAPPIGYIIVEGLNPLEHATAYITTLAPLAGAIATTLLLATAMLVAAVVGMIQTLMSRRNLLPAAIQMASHLGLLLAAWGLFAGGWFVLAVFGLKGGWFHVLARQYSVVEDLVAVVFLLVPQLIWPAVVFVLAWKGTAAARYANR